LVQLANWDLVGGVRQCSYLNVQIYCSEVTANRAGNTTPSTLLICSEGYKLLHLLMTGQ